MDKRSVFLLALLLIGISVPQAMALTAEQVLALKKAGVSDQTIQLMIRQETAASRNAGNEAGMREIKDKDGNVVIVYSAGDPPTPLDASEQENVNRAWDMLHRVIIDGRK